MTPSDTRRSRRPCDDVEAATLAATGLPRCPDHLPDVLCPLPRRIETGACIGCFPARAAFPVTLAGRHPRLHFRGLLRLHSRYGPSGRSTAQGGLCHEASARLLHPTARQLPELPITLWVAPSSTGHPRLFEAHSVIRVRPYRGRGRTRIALTPCAARSRALHAAGYGAGVAGYDPEYRKRP